MTVRLLPNAPAGPWGGTRADPIAVRSTPWWNFRRLLVAELARAWSRELGKVWRSCAFQSLSAQFLTCHAPPQASYPSSRCSYAPRPLLPERVISASQLRHVSPPLPSLSLSRTSQTSGMKHQVAIRAGLRVVATWNESDVLFSTTNQALNKGELEVGRGEQRGDTREKPQNALPKEYLTSLPIRSSEQLARIAVHLLSDKTTRLTSHTRRRTTLVKSRKASYRRIKILWRKLRDQSFRPISCLACMGATSRGMQPWPQK